MVHCEFSRILDIDIQRRIHTPHKRSNHFDAERGRIELKGYEHPSPSRAIATTIPLDLRGGSSGSAHLFRVRLSPFPIFRIISYSARLLDTAVYPLAPVSNHRHIIQSRDHRVQRIHRPLGLLAIKQQEILNWLLPLPQHINNILHQLPAQKRRHRRYLAADILQETSQELAPQRLRGKHQLPVLLRGEGSEEFEIGMGMRGEGAGDALEFPEGLEAGE